MGTEKDNKYYDKIYSEREAYFVHYYKSIYFELWKKVMGLIPKEKELTVFEIGCGTGQFANMLEDNFPLLNYTGIDFSEVAIEKAKQNVKKFGASIFVQDIYKFKLEKKYDLFIALEVLEHLDDMFVLDLIPKGTEFIFTVPNFDDAAHVRWFANENEVRERYYPKMNFSYLIQFQNWFIGAGKIK